MSYIRRFSVSLLVVLFVASTAYAAKVQVMRFPTGTPVLVDTAGSGGGGTWGTITGTLSNQTDLQTALNLKWNNDGTSTATGEWDLGAFDLTADVLYSKNFSSDYVGGGDQNYVIGAGHAYNWKLNGEYVLSLSNAELAIGHYGATQLNLNMNSGNINAAGVTTTNTLRIPQIGGTAGKYSILQGGANTTDLTYTLPIAYPAVSGYVLSSTDAGVMSWIASGGSMVYPGAGIALSTGAAWDTSITNNSANWNTAYGWGNHASAGYAVLVGKSGGQTLDGGTLTTQLLNLRANAADLTSGYVHFLDTTTATNATTAGVVMDGGLAVAKKIYSTDLQVTNTISGDVSGSAATAGSVTNATLTTALTVNTGTVTLVGNVLNTSALTLGAGASSVSGSNTGDQTITLTSDVTGSGTGSFAATIANKAVTLAKMNDMATASLIYRKTAGNGAPEVNTLATLKTDLSLAQADISGLTTASSPAFTGLTLSGLTQGSVLFAGASGVISQDNANAFYDATNHRMGFGTATPLAPLHAVDTSSNSFRGIISEQVSSDINASQINIFKARGTPASKTSPLAGDINGGFFFRGWNGTSYATGGYIRMVFTDNWDATHNGSKLVVAQTLTGGTTQQEVFTLDNGNVILGNQAAIATNATDGFAYIPTCAGTPSGTPTAVTGKAAMVMDSTNHKLYVYDSAWRAGKRVITLGDATSITPNSDTADIDYQLNTQVAGVLTVNVDGGTPINGQSILLKFNCTNAQTFSWTTGAKGWYGGTTALPTVTTAGKIDYLSFIYDSVSGHWQYTGTATGFATS